MCYYIYMYVVCLRNEKQKPMVKSMMFLSVEWRSSGSPGIQQLNIHNVPAKSPNNRVCFCIPSPTLGI